MKHIINIVLLLGFFGLQTPIFSQKTCKVLVPELDSIYIGKCKKGLANGKGEAIGKDTYKGKFKEGLPNGQGTYIWANGDQYTGDWKEGKRTGEGKLTLITPAGDSTIDGLWENNKYMGLKPIPPQVIAKTSIDRYTFRQSGGQQKRVLIDFYQNGMRNTGISNLTLVSSSGIETTLGQSIGFEFVEFPVTIRINYETLNKLKAEKYQAIFEFEISEEGDWIVEIHN
jgi:hypothetical protein